MLKQQPSWTNLPSQDKATVIGVARGWSLEECRSHKSRLMLVGYLRSLVALIVESFPGGLARAIRLSLSSSRRTELSRFSSTSAIARPWSLSYCSSWVVARRLPLSLSRPRVQQESSIFAFWRWISTTRSSYHVRFETGVSPETLICVWRTYFAASTAIQMFLSPFLIKSLSLQL